MLLLAYLRCGAVPGGGVLTHVSWLVIWQKQRAMVLQQEAKVSRLVQNLREAGVTEEQETRLRDLAYHFGLDTAYSSDDAFVDDAFDSYVHELSHALLEGTLTVARGDDYLATSTKTAAVIDRRYSCKKYDRAVWLGMDVSLALQREADVRDAERDMAEIYASAVQFHVFRKLGWALDEDRYCEYTQTATLGLTRAEVFSATYSAMKNRLIEQAANDIVALVNGWRPRHRLPPYGTHAVCGRRIRSRL